MKHHNNDANGNSKHMFSDIPKTPLPISIFPTSTNHKSEGALFRYSWLDFIHIYTKPNYSTTCATHGFIPVLIPIFWNKAQKKLQQWQRTWHGNCMIMEIQHWHNLPKVKLHKCEVFFSILQSLQTRANWNHHQRVTWSSMGNLHTRTKLVRYCWDVYQKNR